MAFTSMEKLEYCFEVEPNSKLISGQKFFSRNCPFLVLSCSVESCPTELEVADAPGFVLAAEAKSVGLAVLARVPA